MWLQDGSEMSAFHRSYFIVTLFFPASARTLRENPVIPPIAAIWNIAKFSISVDGIGAKDLKLGVTRRMGDEVLAE